MRIGIVCYPTFGGSGVVATELGIALAQAGHQVHFMTYKQPVRLNALQPNIQFHEVYVPEYPLFHYQPYELALSSTLVDMVKLHKLDLLHVHYAIPHAYAAYMAKQMLAESGIHIPIVTTLHGSDITLVGSHPFYKPAVTFSINQSDVVTSVSQSLCEDTHRLLGVKREINVVPNFIDILKYDKLREECKRSMMAEPYERIVTHVSNFRPVKRVQDVVRIFKRIVEKQPAKLMMVGDGPDRKMAEDLCAELQIEDHVVFLGNSNDVYRILCFSDLFLLPSQTESFGLAALEAMAARTPVICSNEGGLPEVVQDGVSGYLTPVGDTDAMASKALSLLTDLDQLRTFKEAAYHRAKTFDINHVVPMYLDIYERALACVAR
jgi:N-acetyl-alpha-D-glucosaminyl L-malate synthase BshA